MVSQFLLLILSLCQKVWVNTLGRYATLVLTDKLATHRHFLELGWEMYLITESLMMILFFSSLDYFMPPFYSWLTTLVWGSLTDTPNNSLGKKIVLPSIDTFIQLFYIGDLTTWVWCRIQPYRNYFTCVLILIHPCLFLIVDHNEFTFMFEFHFVWEEPNWRTAVIYLTSNKSEIY